MDVAVAEMAEARWRACRGSAPRTPRAASIMKRGIVVDRHRDVVLRRRAVRALGLGERVAEPPERLGLRLAGGDHRVAATSPSSSAAPSRRSSSAAGGSASAIGRDRLDQHVPADARPASGARVPGICASTSVERLGRGRSRSSRSRRSPPRSRRSSVERGVRAGDADPGDRARARSPGTSRSVAAVTIAQRALRADQQLVEIVAAIVLLERGQPVVDATVGQHRLDARDQRAHRAEAQHLRAAGIGRDQPADRRRCPRAPSVSGKRTPAPRRGVVQVGEDHAGLGDREPGRRHRARGSGSSAAATGSAREPSAGGVAPPTIEVLPPCGTSGTPVLGAARDDRATSAVDAGASIAGARAVKAAAPVGQPRRDVVGIGDDRLGAEPRRAARRACAVWAGVMAIALSMARRGARQNSSRVQRSALRTSAVHA